MTSRLRKQHDESVAKLKQREKKLDELTVEIGRLEEEADIKHAADKAREGPYMPTISRLPYWSEAGEREREKYRQMDEDYARRSLRKVYFSIHDAHTRKNLIKKSREWKEFRRSLLHGEIYNAGLYIGVVGQYKHKWVRDALIFAIIMIFFAFLVSKPFGYEIPAVVLASTVTIILAQQAESAESHWRQEQIKWANDDLQLARDALAEYNRDPETFSEEEENTGVPDENHS